MRKCLFFALIGIITMSCEQTILNSGSTGIQCNLTWTITRDGVLTISGRGEMINFNRSWDVPWDAYRETIRTVVVENGVTRIGDLSFFGNGNLTTVIIGNDVTSIGDRAFGYSTSLTSLIIGNNVEVIGRDAFEYSENLTSVILPNSIIHIASWAFRNSGLTSVVISENVRAVGSGAFEDCHNLTSVTIENGVGWIGGFTFANTNLTSVIIPNSVEFIGNYAFRNSGLTSVVIGSGVELILEGAFAGCNDLISITCYALIPPAIDFWNTPTGIFEGVNKETATLRVPAQSIELYRQAQGWQDFQNIVAIE